MVSLQKTMLASAMVMALGGTAMAADPVVFEEAPAPVIVDTVYDWSGVYIGLQGGYGWAEAELEVLGDPEGSEDLDGPFVGAYAGYNWQWGSFVAGVEGDINASWIEFEEDDDSGEIDWFGSLRGRAGFAWDRTLLFGTVGVAHAEVSGGDDDLGFTGWTAGLGVEHAFTDNWLGRAEYRYYDFGSEDVPEIRAGEIDLDMHTVSVGIAYKF